MSKNYSIKTEILKFKEYVYKSRWYLFLYGIAFIIVYGAWIYNIYPRFDTDYFINNPKQFLNWTEIERQGLIFTKYLLNQQWYNPLLSTTFSYLILYFSGIIYGYLLYRVGSISYKITSSFSLLCFVSPIMAEQLYFELQALEIAVAYCICFLAIGLSYYSIITKKYILKVVTILLLVWCFSSYQSFVFIYIAGVIACYILLFERWTIKEKKVYNNKIYWEIIIYNVIFVIIAMVLNKLLVKIFFNSTEYLDAYNTWLTSSKLDAIKNIINAIKYILFTNNRNYTYFFLIFVLLSILTTSFYVIKNTKNSMKWMCVVAVIGLQICVFLLAIYLANIPVLRSQITYPFVLAVDMIIVMCSLYSSKIIKYICVLSCIICIWLSIGTTMRVIYTNIITSQEDIRVATQIEQLVIQQSDLSKPIVFIGKYNSNTNNATSKDFEYIGLSYYNWSYQAQPYYYHSSKRICEMLQGLGFQFIAPTIDQVNMARQYAIDMPSWPSKESVLDAGEITIVKFSEDEFKSELLNIDN